jgi:deoxyribonuclease I
MKRPILRVRRASARSRPKQPLWRVLLILLVAGCGAPSEPRPPRPPVVAPQAPRVAGSFERAKRLARGVYRDHRVTLYCECAYDARQRVDGAACGYTARRPGTRSRRVEWEHVVSAYELGAHRACWRGKSCRDSHGRRYGGRRCCRARDDEFARMEADLHNLVPEIGELNADRTNYGFGEVEGERRQYGACDFEIDRRSRTAEPTASVRGDIARAYLYMHEIYGPIALPLAPAELARLQAWHRSDPPTAWEHLRNTRIGAIQGVTNPWLDR